MKFYGELLVFVLLFITNFRVFFVNHVRRDPLVVLAPFTFVVAILQIFAWGIDAFTALGVIIALFVLLSNFHAIFRYIEYLYVDHYSPLMKVWAVFTIIITLFAMAGTIYFKPLEARNIDLGITETKIFYKGSFRGGFEKANPFDSKDLTIYKYEGEASSELPPILFMPDKRADTASYRPYLQQLAAKGATVYSADFFADDGKWLHSAGDIKILRRLVMIVHSYLNNQWFMSQREYYTYNISKEYEVLLKLINEDLSSQSSTENIGSQSASGNPPKLFLITDVMGNTAAADLFKKDPQNIAGTFALDSIEEYKTAGYGFVEYTDPLLALALGRSKASSFELAEDMAEKTLANVPHVEDQAHTEGAAPAEDTTTLSQ